MNFKGNSFSLGAGTYVSSGFKDGHCEIFIKNNGIIGCRKFNPLTRTIFTADKAFSYAELCWRAGGGIIEFTAGKFRYEERK